MLLLRLTGPHSEIAWPYTYACNVQVKSIYSHLFNHWVGQGFWVYGIQGLFKSGIRYKQLKYGYSVYHFL